MLTKRLIACLDVLDGKVVKGTQFKKHEVMGEILDLALRYRDDGIDELVFYDISASADGRRVSAQWVNQVAKILNIPFCVAGGIKTEKDAAEILYAGADKVSVNTPALENPELINRLADQFGRQCVVIGVDSFWDGEAYRVCSYTGRESTTQNTGRKSLQWLAEVQDRGAGEVVLNCMDRDGTGSGYDLSQLRAAREVLTIPLVASGGAKLAQDFEDVFLKTGVDAALAARAFHNRSLQAQTLKEELSQKGIRVRL